MSKETVLAKNFSGWIKGKGTTAISQTRTAVVYVDGIGNLRMEIIVDKGNVYGGGQSSVAKSLYLGTVSNPDVRAVNETLIEFSKTKEMKELGWKGNGFTKKWEDYITRGMSGTLVEIIGRHLLKEGRPMDRISKIAERIVAEEEYIYYIGMGILDNKKTKIGPFRTEEQAVKIACLHSNKNKQHVFIEKYNPNEVESAKQEGIKFIKPERYKKWMMFGKSSTTFSEMVEFLAEHSRQVPSIKHVFP